MNIDEYREMKAKETKEVKQDEPKESVKEEPKVNPEENKTEEKPKDKPVENDKKTETKVPEKIEIPGYGEVSVEELKKGYLRQTDYTKKTQDLAHQRKEMQDATKFYEMIRKNPEVAKEIAGKMKMPELDPAVAKVMELENKIYDMMLEQEIADLQAKYEDFDVQEVLQIASDRGISRLEDAYIISKRSKTPKDGDKVDVEALKKQLREEIVKEIEKERDETKTLISTKNSQETVKDNKPVLTKAEQKVARNMFRNSKDPDSEYVKWRDYKKR